MAWNVFAMCVLRVAIEDHVAVANEPRGLIARGKAIEATGGLAEEGVAMFLHGKNGAFEVEMKVLRAPANVFRHGWVPWLVHEAIGIAAVVPHWLIIGVLQVAGSWLHNFLLHKSSLLLRNCEVLLDRAER